MKIITFNDYISRLKDRKTFTVRRLSSEVYHKGRAVSSSMLKAFADNASPQEIYHRFVKIDAPSRDTPAFIFGRAFHKICLERPRFFDDFAIYEGKTRRGKNFDEFAAKNIGKDIITNEIYDDCRRLRDVLYKVPEVRSLLTGGIAESSTIWIDEETGVKCKARADYIKGDVVIDLKTCANASRHAFNKDMIKYYYYIQAGHYMEGFDKDYFAFIVIDKGIYPRVHVIDLSDQYYEMADAARRTQMQRVAYFEAHYTKNKEWPAANDTHLVLDPPSYIYNQVMENAL